MTGSYIIIFLDLVDYSTNNEPIQLEMFKKMQREIHHVLYDEIYKKTCILIPTGDGMIIGLKNSGVESFKLTLSTLTDILEWSNNNGYSFRSALHVGSVNVVKDINKHENLVGNLINDTSRIVSSGDTGSIVVSKYFFEEFLRKKELKVGIEYNIDDTYSFTLIDEGNIFDKHTYVHSIYSILISKKGVVFGSEKPFRSNFFTRIYSDEYPKTDNLKEKFNEKINSSSNVIFYGIYNKSVPDILKHINVNKHRKVSITVIYAADDLEREISDYFTGYDQNLHTKHESMKKTKEFFNEHKLKDNITLKLFEYNIIPSFGASFIDVEDQGDGFMHISNYIRGIVPSKTPYFELEWKLQKQQPLYKFYADYFKNVIMPNLAEINF
jgi:hypothetical protein